MNEHELKLLAKQKHLHQVAVMKWAKEMSAAEPGLELLHAIHHGGYRVESRAGKSIAEGVKNGLPHLFLPVARAQYHGLYIYLAMPGVKLSGLQRAWFLLLEQQGYAVLTCVSFCDARGIIDGYIDPENTPDVDLLYPQRHFGLTLDEAMQ